jgi:hypothetical protein
MLADVDARLLSPAKLPVLWRKEHGLGLHINLGPVRVRRRDARNGHGPDGGQRKQGTATPLVAFGPANVRLFYPDMDTSF